MATLIIVSTLPRGSAAPVSDNGMTLASDEVAMAISLESRAAAEAVRAGDLVSVVSVSDDGFSSIIAESARVLRAGASGGFGSSDAAITLAVDEAAALRLAGAPARGTLTVMIRPPQP